MMRPSRGSLSTGQTDTTRRIIIQENGLWNLRYWTQLDNETLGTPQGIFFHLYKEHSIKCFFIWTGGVELFFPLSFPQKVSCWILAYFIFLLFIACFYSLSWSTLPAYPAFSQVDGNTPTLPLEMLITKERHNGFTGWCIGDASRGFWCLRFMGHLLSCCWSVLVLWRLHLT